VEISISEIDMCTKIRMCECIDESTYLPAGGDAVPCVGLDLIGDFAGALAFSESEETEEEDREDGCPHDLVDEHLGADYERGGTRHEAVEHPVEVVTGGPVE